MEYHSFLFMLAFKKAGLWNLLQLERERRGNWHRICHFMRTFSNINSFDIFFENGHLLDKLLWISSSLCVLVSTPFLYYWYFPSHSSPLAIQRKMIEAIIMIFTCVLSGWTHNFFPWYFTVWPTFCHLLLSLYIKVDIHTYSQCETSRLLTWSAMPFFNFRWRLCQFTQFNNISFIESIDTSLVRFFFLYSAEELEPGDGSYMLPFTL